MHDSSNNPTGSIKRFRQPSRAQQPIYCGCMFVIAQITNLAVKVGEDPNIFGVSDGVRTFFNTGLLVALITTIVASLTWRVIASSFVNFLVLIIWLAFLERGQGSTLGLQNFFNEKYSDSHPLTFENIQTAKNNLQGFIDGRLFLVLVIVFLIRWLT
jgi:Silicon transporter